MHNIAKGFILPSAAFTLKPLQIKYFNKLNRIPEPGNVIYGQISRIGYPSTYMLNKSQLLHILNSIDLKYANNPKNYWVVELADGIIQRETSLLLLSDEVRTST